MSQGARDAAVGRSEAERELHQHMVELVTLGHIEAALEAYERYRRRLLSLDDDVSAAMRTFATTLLERLADRASIEQALPRPTTSLVGRSRELTRARMLIETGRRVSFVGAPGVGKSRLAVTAARHECRAHGLRPFFVALDGARAQSFNQFVAAAVALEPGGADVRAALVRRLAAEPALLVLDGCEGVAAEVAAFVEAALAVAPELRVLTTSRRRLPGDDVVEIGPLPIDDGSDESAMQLFIERASSARSHFALTEGTRRVIRSICGRLDGVPLALELAASRTALLSLDELDRRLARRPDSLHVALERSVELLDPRARFCFERLGVFRNGWFLASAEAVCGGDDVRADDVFDVLAMLRDSSLVLTEELGGRVRYRMLDTIGSYARTLLQARPGGADAALHAHARHVRDTAMRQEEAVAGGDVDAFAALDAEIANVTAALEFAAVRPSETRTGLETLIATRRYFLARGIAASGLAMADAILAGVAVEDRESAWYGYGLRSAGSLANELGDARRSNVLHAHSREVFRRAGEPSGEALALCSLAAAHYHAGDLAGCEHDLRDALTLLERAGDAGGKFLAYKNLGAVATARGGFERAAAAFEAADALRAHVGAFELENLLTNRANLAFFAGEYATGVAYAAQALALSRRHGYRCADALEVLALNVAMTGDARAAYGYFSESLDALASCDSPPSLIHVLEDLVFCAARDDLDAEALTELAGFASAQRAAIDLPSNPAWLPYMERTCETLEQRLGAEYTVARVRGERATRADIMTRARRVIERGLRERDPLPGLTARESEIAILVARGLRSSEVAHALCVSVRTVDNHLASIYRKLGLQSRIQVAAFVRDAARIERAGVTHATAR